MNADVVVSTDFSTIVSVRPTDFDLDTRTLFDQQHDDSLVSPIDQFFQNTRGLTRLWTGDGADFASRPEVGILLLLGYVSAVESYMRAMIRRVVAIDCFSQFHCEKQQLSYAAAIHHHRTAMLPEALLEESVFNGKKEVLNGLTKFLNIKLEQNNSGAFALLSKFDDVCELRHCCVHRFGKLGTKNAIALGLQGHKEFIEKPVRLTVANIDVIADLLVTLVRSLNNDVFRLILERSATSRLPGQGSLGIGWSWNKHRDRRTYQSYYSIFASTSDAQPSPEAGELYDRFRNVYRRAGRGR